MKLTVGSGGQVLSEQMLDPEGAAVAVDPRTGIVYGDNESSISEYNSAGEYLGSFGEGVISESRGVAVNAASGEVYVSNNNGGSAAPVDAFEEVSVPGAKISEEQATDVNQTAATLQAQINPNKSNTTYHFEYDTSPYRAKDPTGRAFRSRHEHARSVGRGNVPVPVNVRVEGLQPGTSYYYRVVARSEIELGKFEEFDGPDEVFTTPALPGSAPETCSNAGLRSEQPFGLTLPDCRAYELVSPLAKNDNGIEARDGRAAVSGEAFTYLSQGAFAGPQDNTLENRYHRPAWPGWLVDAEHLAAVQSSLGDHQSAVRRTVLHTRTIAGPRVEPSHPFG